MKESKNPMQVDRADKPEQVDESRRRWTKAGLGTGAVLATLAGRPAFAGICQSPSAFSSGNMSHHDTTKSYYVGKSPDDWAGVAAEYLPANPIFHHVFPAGSQANWGDKTLAQVLGNETTGAPGLTPNPISREFVAAYLNYLKDGNLACLDYERLLIMWNDYVFDGQYQVTTGVLWDATKIVTYLEKMRS